MGVDRSATRRNGPAAQRPAVLAAGAGVGLVLVLAAGVVLLRPSPPSASGTALDRLQRASSVPVQISTVDGFPQAVLARVPVRGTTAEERARDYLAQHGELYGISDSANLVTARTGSLAGGGEVVALEQVHRGLRVHAAGLVVPLAGSEALGSTGRLSPALSLAVDPGIGVDEAIDAATGEHPGLRTIGEPELVILDPRLLGLELGEPRLAWQVTVAGASLDRVFIDALTSAEIVRIDVRPSAFGLDLRSAENRLSAQTSACYLASGGTDVGTEAGLRPAHAGDDDAMIALDEFRANHEWFQRTFGRDAVDAAGGRLQVYIHARFEGADGQPVGNAHWVGAPCNLLEFSDGYVVADVVTHEFTHGVVEHTAGLEYVWLSGALNESYADVFAFLRTGDPVMGETLPNGAIRDLEHPASHDQPDRMSELRRPIWSNGRLVDSGWVHSNSGIPNLAAWLIARGGSHPDTGVAVAGIGDDRAAVLYYASLLALSPSADFIQQRIALEQAAMATGAAAAELCAIRNGFAAVEIGAGDRGCDGTLDGGDADGDFVIDRIDNCPDVANGEQSDADGDGTGDACDAGPDGNPSDATGIRLLNLWARNGQAGGDFVLTVDEDLPPVVRAGYGQVTEPVPPPIDPDTGQPAVLIGYPAEDIHNQTGLTINSFRAGDRITAVVHGLGGAFQPWAHLFWEAGDPDPSRIGVHGPAFPDAPDGLATVLLYTGPLEPFGGLGLKSWFYGLDGACLVDAANGEPLDRFIDERERVFAFVTPGRHEIRASARGCDGTAAFGPTSIEVEAGDRVGVFPFGYDAASLGFYVLQMGRTP